MIIINLIIRVVVFRRESPFVLKINIIKVKRHVQNKTALKCVKYCANWFRRFKDVACQRQWPRLMFIKKQNRVVDLSLTRWLYCVECQQYSTRLEALGYLCDCLSGHVQRSQVVNVI